MTGYSKLFGSIITSTIWREDKDTKILWITMLALKNKHGIVEGSVPGLADMARLTVPETKKALEILRSPDPDSRTKEREGRRIEDVDGGWFVINHEKWRRKMNEDERREYLRIKQAEHRQKKSTIVNKRKQKSTPSTHTEPYTEPEAKNTEGANGSRPPVVKKIFDFEKWIESLIADPTYARIDVRREYGKMVAWCKVRGKQSTQRRFINWLNNVDAGLPTPSASTSGVYGKNRLPPPSDITEEQLAIHRAQIQKLSDQWKKEHGL